MVACYREFLIGILESVQSEVVGVKIQIAYFEALGSQGYALYEDMVALAAEMGFVVIADVKRGDIGSTAEAYARAHLDRVGADAVTLNPYFGTDGLEPFFRRVREAGKGVFILVKTSNPSSAELQDLRLQAGPTVYETGRGLRQRLGGRHRGQSGLSLRGGRGGRHAPGAGGGSAPAHARGTTADSRVRRPGGSGRRPGCAFRRCRYRGGSQLRARHPLCLQEEGSRLDPGGEGRGGRDEGRAVEGVRTCLVRKTSPARSSEATGAPWSLPVLVLLVVVGIVCALVLTEVVMPDQARMAPEDIPTTTPTIEVTP